MKLHRRSPWAFLEAICPDFIAFRTPRKRCYEYDSAGCWDPSCRCGGDGTHHRRFEGWVDAETPDGYDVRRPVTDGQGIILDRKGRQLGIFNPDTLDLCKMLTGPCLREFVVRHYRPSGWRQLSFAFFKEDVIAPLEAHETGEIPDQTSWHDHHPIKMAA